MGKVRDCGFLSPEQAELSDASLWLPNQMAPKLDSHVASYIIQNVPQPGGNTKK